MVLPNQIQAQLICILDVGANLDEAYELGSVSPSSYIRNPTNLLKDTNLLI